MFWRKFLKVLESIATWIIAFIITLLALPFLVIGALICLPMDAVLDVWSEK